MDEINRHKKFAEKYEVVDKDYKDMTRVEKERLYDKLAAESKKTDKQMEERRKRIKIKNAKKRRRRFIGRITALGLAATALFAGGKIVNDKVKEYQEQNEPAMVDELLDREIVTLGELDIDSELVSRLEEIENTLEKENLTNQELIRLSKTISDLQFDITKSKLAGVLNVSPDDIKIYTYGVDKDGNNRENVKVYDDYGNVKKLYSNKDIFTNSDTISPEIAEMIRDIGSMQDVMQQLQDGDFKREDIINKYKDFLENTSQFAGMKLQINEKGNITAQKIKVGELDKYDKAVYDAAIKSTSSQQKDSADELEL